MRMISRIVVLGITGTTLIVGAGRTENGEEYPLSPEMVLLERDAGTDEYQVILRDMIPTELAAEWQRAVNPDDAESFAKSHGGREKVLRDRALNAAYEQRRKITSNFLAVMRAEYERRGQKAPFDQGQAAMKVPAARGTAAQEVTIEPIHPSAAAAGQWYRWRGPSGQGNTSLAKDDEIPLQWSDKENILWKAELLGNGNSSPVLWEDRIFVTTSSEDGKTRSLVCLNKQDGNLSWKRDVPVKVLEKSVIAKNGHASSTPTTDGERVFAFLGNAGMVAWDLDGTLLWKADLGTFDGMHGPGASPVLYDDLAILVQDQNNASLSIALEKKTGRVRWRQDRPGCMGWCTPVVLRVDGRDELLYSSDSRLVSLDPATGKELWSCEGPTREPVPSIVFGKGLIYCTSGRNGPTLAVVPGGGGDVTSSHLVWTAARGGPHVPSPVLVDSLLYLVNDRGILTCLDALTGETVYQKRLNGKFSASPIAIADRLYLASEEGPTYIIQTGRKFEIAATNDLGEPLLASLALQDGILFARTPSAVWAIGRGH